MWRQVERETVHFRLPSVAQKRRLFKLPFPLLRLFSLSPIKAGSRCIMRWRTESSHVSAQERIQEHRGKVPSLTTGRQ